MDLEWTPDHCYRGFHLAHCHVNGKAMDYIRERPVNTQDIYQTKRCLEIPYSVYLLYLLLTQRKERNEMIPRALVTGHPSRFDCLMPVNREIALV